MLAAGRGRYGLAAARLALGEVHPDPSNALSDKECQIPLADFADMFSRVMEFSNLQSEKDLLSKKK